MADKRISGLPAVSTAAREDLLLLVDDPAGIPSNKKISLTQFFSNVEPETVFANTKILSSSTNAAVIFKGGVGVQESMKIDNKLTVNALTVLNIATITSLSSNLIGTTNALYDLGNTTVGWKNAYVSVINGSTDENLLITANTNASANITFTGANVYITSNTILAGTNTVVSSNSTFTSDNVSITGANVYITSNSTFAGTNTVISSNSTFTSDNVSITGANVYITSNSTFAGTNTVISSNITLLATNTHIISENLYSSANATLAGSLTTITSNVNITANVSLTSTIDTTSNSTGALTLSGGLGIAKSAVIGGNLNVHGNIHANGNITADGGTIALGDSNADTVTFNADIGSDILPNIDSVYDLGNTTNRFANAYVDELTITGNVVVASSMTATGNVSGAFGIFSDNVSISGTKELIFRDAALTINSPIDGEIEIASDDLITFTATSNVEVDSAIFNVISNSVFAGTNTNITSNVTLSGTNTNISSSNLSITGSGATIDGTLMNVKSNVDMTGIITVGSDGLGKNFTIYSGTAGNKIKLKALSDQLVSNTQIESSEKIRTDGSVFVSNGSSLVFGSQFKIMDTTNTTGFLLQEDGTASGSGTEGGRLDLETDEEAKITHNLTDGFIFSDKINQINVSSTTNSTSTTSGAIKTAGGLGVVQAAWFGGEVHAQSSLALAGATITTGSVGSGAGILAIKNGTAPTTQGVNQAYLYARDDVAESHIYTMDEGGNETKLGPHNENNEWEFYSRNVKTGKVIRVNMERMIRKLEEFTGNVFIEEY